MKPAVEQYEAKMVFLRKAMMRVVAVIEIGQRKLKKQTDIVSRIDEFGNFSNDLMKLHGEVAVERCDLENMAVHRRNEVLQRTTTIVGTLEATTKQTVVQNFKKGHPNAVVKLIGLDEITRAEKYSIRLCVD